MSKTVKLLHEAIEHYTSELTTVEADIIATKKEIKTYRLKQQGTVEQVAAWERVLEEIEDKLTKIKESERHE